MHDLISAAFYDFHSVHLNGVPDDLYQKIAKKIKINLA